MTAYWPMLKQTVAEWTEDLVPRLAAALAFYTMLSIAPMLIISLKIIGMILGEEAATGGVQKYMVEMMGKQGAMAISEMLQSAGQQSSGLVATIVSLGVLLFSASAVFGELQASMNTIWDVAADKSGGLLKMVKDRFFSITLVLGVAFLLLVSLVISTVISGLSERFLPGQGWLWAGVHFTVSIAFVALLFALMFKYLPDVTVQWRSVWVGAAITAVLFTIGKFLLGWYLGRESTTSIYGAFGSLVALLLWVYYSAQIFLFGGEFTQVYAKAHGHVVEPSPTAEGGARKEHMKRDGVLHDEDVKSAEESAKVFQAESRESKSLGPSES